MQSTLPDSFFAAFKLAWNEEPNSYIQTTSGYLTNAWLAPVTQTSFGHFPCETNTAYHEEKTSFTSPANTAITQVPLGSSSSSPSLTSSWGDSILWERWRSYPEIPSTVGQGCYSTIVGQGSRDDYQSSPSPPSGLGFDGNSAIPPGLGVNVPTAEAVDVRPGHYGANYLDGSAQRMSKRQKSERSAGQPVGQGGPDRRFTCTFDNCGKDFSGEWEKMRHIKSIHGPPTIGCRECPYKQSRKDLFSEHCRKRHPGESVEGLMVDLATTAE